MITADFAAENKARAHEEVNDDPNYKVDSEMFGGQLHRLRRQIDIEQGLASITGRMDRRPNQIFAKHKQGGFLHIRPQATNTAMHKGAPLNPSESKNKRKYDHKGSVPALPKRSAVGNTLSISRNGIFEENKLRKPNQQPYIALKAASVSFKSGQPFPKGPPQPNTAAPHAAHWNLAKKRVAPRANSTTPRAAIPPSALQTPEEFLKVFNRAFPVRSASKCGLQSSGSGGGQRIAVETPVAVVDVKQPSQIDAVHSTTSQAARSLATTTDQNEPGIFCATPPMPATSATLLSPSVLTGSLSERERTSRYFDTTNVLEKDLESFRQQRTKIAREIKDHLDRLAAVQKQLEAAETKLLGIKNAHCSKCSGDCPGFRTESFIQFSVPTKSQTTVSNVNTLTGIPSVQPHKRQLSGVKTRESNANSVAQHVESGINVVPNTSNAMNGASSRHSATPLLSEDFLIDLGEDGLNKDSTISKHGQADRQKDLVLPILLKTTIASTNHFNQPPRELQQPLQPIVLHAQTKTGMLNAFDSGNFHCILGKGTESRFDTPSTASLPQKHMKKVGMSTSRYAPEASVPQHTQAVPSALTASRDSANASPSKISYGPEELKKIGTTRDANTKVIDYLTRYANTPKAFESGGRS
jgi:hypothetical protein